MKPSTFNKKGFVSNAVKTNAYICIYFSLRYENIFTTHLTVQGWRKTYSAKDKTLKNVRNAEDYEMIGLPEQVQIYEKSDHAIQAK